VPGDVVRLGVADVVPTDVRLLEVNGLECDEAVLTAESLPAGEDRGRDSAAGWGLELNRDGRWLEFTPFLSFTPAPDPHAAARCETRSRAV